MSDLIERAADESPAVEREVRALLAELYEPEDIPRWLAAPHELLGGESAEALIARGEGGRVVRLLRAMLEGVYL